MTLLASVQTAQDFAPVSGWLVLAAVLSVAGCLLLTAVVIRRSNRLIDNNVRRHVDKALPLQQSSNVTRIESVKRVKS